MAVFGFCAAGSAGNPSLIIPEALRGAVDAALEGASEGFAEVDDGVAQGTGPVLPAPTRLADVEVPEAMGGKGLELPLGPFEPQLPCLLTALRLDCAVDDFSLRILRPPLAG